MVYTRPRSPFYWADAVIDGERHRFSTKRRHLFPDPADPPKRLNAEQRKAKEEAEAVVAEFTRSRLNQSQLGHVETITIGEAVERYLARCSRLSDYRSIESRCRKLIGRRIEDGSVSDRVDPKFEGRFRVEPDTPFHHITTAVVEKMRMARQKEGNSPATINHDVGMLRSIYRLAKDTWGVKVAPSIKFDMLPTQSKLRYLSREEAAAFLRELDPKREIKNWPPYEKRSLLLQRRLQEQYDLAVFLLDTGARYSEISTITWDCVDTIEWNTINIYRSKVGSEGILVMTRRLREILRRRWDARRNSPYVFPAREGDGHRGYATSGIIAAMNRAGINASHKVRRFGKATTHTLRDTFASWLVQKGFTLYRVQKLLGHTSPQMTQKYAHLAEEDVALEAASVLDELAEEEAAA